MLSNINEIKVNHVLPNESIPSNTDVIITTEIEKKELDFKNIFVPKAFNHYYLFSNILLLAKNKNYFDEIIVGIDPGKTTGFAVLAEKEIVLGEGEFYTAVDAVKEVITVFFNIETSELIIRVGAGGGPIKDEIVRRLNEIFRDKVPIEVVNEDFTSQKRLVRFSKKFSKDVKSAILIALQETSF
ncbi:MAG: hypothetical protein ACTSQF_02325 [Candidatus Heimdallarchaeaceae archaeon]